jgi:hypothetical protein
VPRAGLKPSERSTGGRATVQTSAPPPLPLPPSSPPSPFRHPTVVHRAAPLQQSSASLRRFRATIAGPRSSKFPLSSRSRVPATSQVTARGAPPSQEGATVCAGVAPSSLCFSLPRQTRASRVPAGKPPPVPFSLLVSIQAGSQTFLLVVADRRSAAATASRAVPPGAPPRTYRIQASPVLVEVVVRQAALASLLASQGVACRRLLVGEELAPRKRRSSSGEPCAAAAVSLPRCRLRRLTSSFFSHRRTPPCRSLDVLGACRPCRCFIVYSRRSAGETSQTPSSPKRHLAGAPDAA